jgi:hypothetical protein
MKALLLLCFTLLVTACSTTDWARETATPEWLVGTWLMAHEGDRDLIACASSAPIAYAPDGTYNLFEERGTWHLEGNRLTETATEAYETADPGTVQIGRPYVSRIERVGPDEFLKTYASGERETFLRCPAPE